MYHDESILIGILHHTFLCTSWNMKVFKETVTERI